MDILSLYRETGALLEGHFLLRSGRHAGHFLQSTTVLQHPLYAEAIGEQLAQSFENLKVDFVIGPAMGGVVLAFVVARALGVRALFAEKAAEGGMFVREGLTVRPGERFLVVEDVLTTGSSALRTAQAAGRRGAELAALGAIIDRSNSRTTFDVPYRSLLKAGFPSFEPSGCPLCQEGLKLEEV